MWRFLERLCSPDTRGLAIRWGLLGRRLLSTFIDFSNYPPAEYPLCNLLDFSQLRFVCASIRELAPAPRVTGLCS